MGRPPIGAHAMTNAERQRRHRANRAKTKSFRNTVPVTKPRIGDASLRARIIELEGALARERNEHHATHALYVRALDAVKGVFTRAEFRKLRALIAPDRVTHLKDADLTKRLTEAAAFLNRYEDKRGQGNLLVKKAERGRPQGPTPLTRADMEALKRAATAARKASRERARPIKPSSLPTA
jgi:hypothetical protein